MSLLKCPECGKDVSDRAGICVHCGYPLDELYVKSSPRDDESADFKVDGCLSTEDDSSKDKVDEIDPEEFEKAKVFKSSESQTTRRHPILLAAVVFAIVLLVANNAQISKNEQGDTSPDTSYETPSCNVEEQIVLATGYMAETNEDIHHIYNDVMSIWTNSLHKVQDEKTDRYTLSNSGFVPTQVAISNYFKDAETQKRVSYIADMQSKISQVASAIDDDSYCVKEFLELENRYYIHADAIMEAQGDIAAYQHLVVESANNYYEQLEVVISMIESWE